MAWVLQLPDDDNKLSQINRVVNHWSTQDPVASAQWIDSLPTGKVRDYASSTFVWRVAQSQPEAAFNQAASISDPKLQQQVLSNLYNSVSSSDPARAQALLQRSNLPDDVKQKIMAQGSK